MFASQSFALKKHNETEKLNDLIKENDFKNFEIHFQLSRKTDKLTLLGSIISRDMENFFEFVVRECFLRNKRHLSVILKTVVDFNAIRCFKSFVEIYKIDIMRSNPSLMLVLRLKKIVSDPMMFYTIFDYLSEQNKKYCLNFFCRLNMSDMIEFMLVKNTMPDVLCLKFMIGHKNLRFVNMFIRKYKIYPSNDCIAESIKNNSNTLMEQQQIIEILKIFIEEKVKFSLDIDNIFYPVCIDNLMNEKSVDKLLEQKKNETVFLFIENIIQPNEILTRKTTIDKILWKALHNKRDVIFNYYIKEGNLESRNIFGQTMIEYIIKNEIEF